MIYGIQFAVDNKAAYGIRVINLSLSSTVAESFRTDPLDAAAESAWFSGLVVVTAAGNEGAANDGVTFGSAVSLGAANVNLPFSRGYVHFTTHNHATLKYSDGKIDAWTARWDNVGFDGPAITSGFREYEALDSLSPANNGKVNVGWRLPDASASPPVAVEPVAIEIKNVNPSGAVRARLAAAFGSDRPAALIEDVVAIGGALLIGVALR